MALPDYLPPDTPEWRKYAEEFRATDPGLATQFDRLQKPIAGLNETSLNELSRTIKEGLDRGYSAMQIANGVSDEGYIGIAGKFRGFEDWRSEMIARTEAREAFNAGGLRAYADAGTTYVEAIDGDYDERCRVRNGERFPFDPVTGEIQADASELEEHPNGGLTWGPAGGGKIDLFKPIAGETAAAAEAALLGAEIPSWAAESVAAARAAFDEAGGLVPWRTIDDRGIRRYTEDAFMKPGHPDTGWVRLDGETPTPKALAQLDHIKAVGTDIEAEIERRTGGYFKKVDEAQADFLKAQQKEAAAIAKRTKLYQQQNRAANETEYEEIRAKIDKMRPEIMQLMNGRFEAEERLAILRTDHPDVTIKEVLAEIRGMGGDLAGNLGVDRGYLNDAATFYPTDWVAASNESKKFFVLLSDSDVPEPLRGRGFYTSNENLGGIYLPGKSQNPTLGIHELGHRMEDTNDSVQKSEWLFWHSRTDGEETKKLSELTGNSEYGDKEIARLDKFSNPYMGKDYGAKPDSSYELLTMGMEAMKAGKYTIDADYRQWLLGTLGLL